MNRFNKSAQNIQDFTIKAQMGIEKINEMRIQLAENNENWYNTWTSSDLRFSTHSSDFGKVILRSAYSIYLKKWYRLFKKNEEIMTIDGSELYNDPPALLERVQKFLGVEVLIDQDNFYFDKEKGLYCSIKLDGQTKCAGKEKGRSVRSEVPPQVKQRLKAVIQPFINELEEIEGKSFAHWDW